jgi:cysteine synthase A
MQFIIQDLEESSMTLRVANHQIDLIGNTPLLKLTSLSELTGCEIFAKCEHFNPGGSIKDRAALQMVKEAMESGKLKSGMTIVEGTAGNTGIGLALVAKHFGLKMLAVMPQGQTPEKEKMISLFGAELKLVPVVPFKDENHFYHTARKIAEQNPTQYWWANQFENLSNYHAHYLNTGPEIFLQMQGDVDYLVCAAGSGGTIAGNSVYLKQRISKIKVHLVDPMGSGLAHYFKHGEFKSTGSSITEGIGIMRLVENFKQAIVDDAFNIEDQDLVTMAHYMRERDGIVVGSSSALNLCGAIKTAMKAQKGSRIVTFLCDLGERSYSKLYNHEYLLSKNLQINTDMDQLIKKYGE